MPRYGILVTPAMNQVYADASVGLMRGELEIMSETALDGRIHDITHTTIGGAPYVTFDADDLGERDVAYLSNLSSMYALFAFDGELLRPVEPRRLDVMDDDLMTIQKYSGKTNQHFTKLLLNISVLSSDRAREMLTRKLSVFDPLCGRGTTLNQAMTYGYDAAGMEIDRKDYEAYATFIQTYVKNKRLKHHAEAGPIKRNRQVVARRLALSIGLSKESFKAGETIDLTVVNADTVTAPTYFRRETFDAVVTDLPYGVQHGSQADETLARRPATLLDSALPVWFDLLRPGGAIGLAFNSRVGRRELIAEVVAANGFEPLESAPYLGLRHRVDQAITRDVLVARRPAS
jgi:SAM-dependent methyltransferase